MPDRSSGTIFGGRCRKRLRWCRELRWVSICSVRGAAEAPVATIRANSKKKSFSSELNGTPATLSALVIRKNKQGQTRMSILLQWSSADPAAAQHAIAVIKHSCLSRSDGALRRIESDARAIHSQRLNGCCRRLVLVANFCERA